MNDLVRSVKAIVENAFIEQAKAKARLEAINDSYRYSDTMKSEALNGYRDELDTITNAAHRKAAAIEAEAKKEADKRFSLNSADLNDDAKLLNAGVPLNKQDLEAIFDRNDKYTMKSLVNRYAEANDIRIDRDLDTKANEYERIESVTHSYLNSALSRPEYKDMWLDNQYLDSISW